MEESKSARDVRCEWTIETLRHHFEAMLAAREQLNQQRFAALRDSSQAAMDAATTAVTKAEMATEKRLESVNEFRNTLSDQQRNLIPRAEFEALEKSTRDHMKAMENSIMFRLEANDKQIAEIRGVWTTQQLEARANQHGMKGGWAAAVGVIGLVAILLSLLSMAAAFLEKAP